MSAPTLSELSAQIDELKAVIGYLNRSLSELRYENDVDAENLNIAWILITGFFIFFMQAGFTLVEVGGVRLLNSTVVLLKVSCSLLNLITKIILCDFSSLIMFRHFGSSYFLIFFLKSRKQ